MSADASDLARHLAARVDSLCAELLPGGHREGPEWRCGSTAGEAGGSLGVRLRGEKAGVWADFATGEVGDALDLVRSALGLSTVEAMDWARRWLGIAPGEAAVPRRTAPAKPPAPAPDSERWRRPWRDARPIEKTLASRYLCRRGLRFDDLEGEVLRFHARQARQGPPDGNLEFHPALLARLSAVRTGEPCGIINIFLRPDGLDRLRDRKGKTCAGRAKDAAVMLVDFAEVTMSLTVCEGTETGVALLLAGQGPVWACGGAGNLASFPVLAGIEALTVAADADEAGQRAAEAVAARWQAADREVMVIAPPAGDWADR